MKESLTFGLNEPFFPGYGLASSIFSSASASGASASSSNPVTFFFDLPQKVATCKDSVKLEFDELRTLGISGTTQQIMDNDKMRMWAVEVDGCF